MRLENCLDIMYMKRKYSVLFLLVEVFFFFFFFLREREDQGGDVGEKNCIKKIRCQY